MLIIFANMDEDYSKIRYMLFNTEVVESVYEVFKHKKGRLRKGVKEQIARSRFMVLPDGMERLQSVNDTLKKYGNCKARDLVSIAHSKDSPWSLKDCKKEYQEIEDEIIKAYHGNEENYFEQMYLGEKGDAI